MSNVNRMFKTTLTKPKPIPPCVGPSYSRSLFTFATTFSILFKMWQPLCVHVHCLAVFFTPSTVKKTGRNYTYQFYHGRPFSRKGGGGGGPEVRGGGGNYRGVGRRMQWRIQDFSGGGGASGQARYKKWGEGGAVRFRSDTKSEALCLAHSKYVIINN